MAASYLSPQLQCTFISENTVLSVPLHVVSGPLFPFSHSLGRKIRLTPHNSAVKPMLMSDLDNSCRADTVSLRMNAPGFTRTANKVPQKIPYLPLIQHLWPSRGWEWISVSMVRIPLTPALIVHLGRLYCFARLLNDFPLLRTSTAVRSVVGVAWGSIMENNQIVISTCMNNSRS